MFFINGHTDGNSEYNQGLSQRRAEAVKRYLIEHFKLAPDTLVAVGLGKEGSQVSGPAVRRREPPRADRKQRSEGCREVKQASLSLCVRAASGGPLSL